MGQAEAVAPCCENCLLPTDEVGVEGGSSYGSAAEGLGEAPVCRADSFADWMRIAVLVCTHVVSGFLLLRGMEEADLRSVVHQLDPCLL